MADPKLLPAPTGTPAELAADTTLMNLGTLFAAVPWGAPLPTLKFNALGTPPCYVHTLVGDTMWKDCWKDQHENITGAHYVPYKLLNIVKWTVEQLNLQHTNEELEKGRVRYGAVEQVAAKRRQGGSPY